MRCHVYRNLDKPFQIFGFSAIELTILCFTLVGGTELTLFLAISRAWAFAITIVLSLSFFWLRRSLGDLFVRRIIRFVELPNQLSSKIIKMKNIP